MIGVVVFSRYNSTRLPGKALKDMGGRPLLGRILDRLRGVRSADKLIVATSDLQSDDALAAFVEGEAGVELFRGSLDDVSGRALECMRAHNLDVLVRICGDSPFEIPAMIDDMVARREASDADLVTNVQDRTYPSGLSVEVIARAPYERAYAAMSDAQDLEHVTRYLYRHPDDFQIENVASGRGQDLTRLNLCVDTADDFARATWIIDRLGDDFESAGLELLIACAEAWYVHHPEDTGKAT
ncbi:cytidylyltransferase domain-containing protein [Pseudomonadota bacterium]